MPLIPIAMALAQFAPMIAGWLGGQKAEEVAGKVVGIAQQVTGQSSPDATVAAIAADPNLAMQFQKAVLEQQAHLAEIAADVTKAELTADTANTAAVNATMQAEAKSDHWPTYTWRPFIGFCFGINLVLSTLMVIGVFGAQVFNAPGADKAIAALPAALGSLSVICGLAAPILGISSYFRGKMQADPRIPTDNRG